MTDNPYKRFFNGAQPQTFQKETTRSARSDEKADAGKHGEVARTAERRGRADLFDELAEVRTKMENSRNILELLSRMNMNSADLLRNRDHHQKQIRMLLEKEFDIMERMSAGAKAESRDPGGAGKGAGIPTAEMSQMREQ